MMTPMSLRLRALVPLVALLGLVAAACGTGGNEPVNSSSNQSSSGPAPSAVVHLHFVSFEPASVTIHAGQTVEWIWNDAPVAHNVTFADFASPTQATGTFFHTFDTPGDYTYRCTVHATMTAVVHVVP